MDIPILAARGEFVSGVAVGISRICLALQIRQSSKLRLSSIASAVVDAT